MNKFLIVFAGLLGLVACNEEKITSYEGENYIYFSDSYLKDSTTLSFFYHPEGTKSLSVGLPMEISGDLFSAEKSFSIVLDEVYSVNATEQDFEFKDPLVWKSGLTRDTVEVLVKYSAKLDREEVRLVLKVEQNENFAPGAQEFRKVVIRFSNLKVQPTWWDKVITEEYLGRYSEEKYDAFKRITGVGDLTDMDYSEVRALAVAFKLELINAGDSIKDPHTGEPMYKTVPVIV